MLVIVAPKATTESATKLANTLRLRVYNPNKQEVPYGKDVNYINYGCSSFNRHHQSDVFNQPFSVKVCIDKLATLLVFKQLKIPHPEFVHRKELALKWDKDDVVVCHTSREGRQNKGIEYRHPDELVDAYLYTKYFFHKREYRVLVFKGKVIGIYSKVEDGEGKWDLITLQLRGFDEIISACEKASAALKMDFVGFDVLAKTRKDFVIIEANSGPMITDEALEAFKKHFN
jgi:glutathione synthase/RimK-type ligase-like ATP-grasp enzyme